MWEPLEGCAWLVLILVICLILYGLVRLLFPDFIPQVVEPFVSRALQIGVYVLIGVLALGLGYFILRMNQKKQPLGVINLGTTKTKRKRSAHVVDENDELLLGDDGELIQRTIKYKFSGNALRHVTEPFVLEVGTYRISYEYNGFEKMQIKVLNVSDGKVISSVSDLKDKGSTTFYCDQSGKYVLEIALKDKYTTRWKVEVVSMS